MDEKVCEERHRTVTERLDDHEDRLRVLEKNDMKREVQFAEIQKSQAELKSLVMESSKEQNKTINHFMETILEMFKNKESNENEIKFYKTKQFWAVVISIVTALSSIAVAIFK